MRRNRMSGAWLPMYAFALGAGLMFLYDPVRGRSRRAVLSDMAVGRLHRFGWFGNKAVRDLSNRAVGFAARVRGMFSARLVPDTVLRERVRSRLGHIVSHPGALETIVRGGRVTLCGPILASEVDAALRAVSQVRGVREVIQGLEVHSQHDIPALQGGVERIRQWVLEPQGYSPGVRLLLGLSGMTLVFYGIGRGGLIGKAAAVGGGGLAIWSFGQLSVGSAGRRGWQPARPIMSREPAGVEEVEVAGGPGPEITTPMGPAL